MKPDQELLKTFSITLNEGIVDLTFLTEEKNPEDNTQRLQLVLESISNVFKENQDKRFKLLVDLKPIGSGSYVSNQTQELYSKSQIFRQFTKIAVVTPSILMKVFVHFVTEATGKSGFTQIFENKEDALEWLKKETPSPL